MADKDRPVTVYYENWLLKKEGVNNWDAYWGIIRGKWLQFYERGNSIANRPELRKTLELTTSTQCSLVSRKKNRFPFAINNGLGTYYLKCATELERYHWIFSILSAALGKPKEPLPRSVPESMLEKSAFKVHDKAADKKTPQPISATQRPISSKPTEKENVSPGKKVVGAGDTFSSRRRQKYGNRLEQKAKLKKEKRAKKLGLKPDELDDDSPEPRKRETNCDTNLRRTRNLKSDIVVSHRPTAAELERTMRNRARHQQQQRSPQPVKEHVVTADIHSPTRATSTRNLRSGDVNDGFEDDDIEVFPQVRVTLDDSQELPNMVVMAISDSDDDTESPANTSISSTSTYLSLASVDIGGKTSRQNSPMPTRKHDVDTVVTETLITDDNKVRRRPISGGKSPRPVLQVEPARVEIPGMLGIPDESVMDRPLTPMMSRPLTPNKPQNYSRYSFDSYA